MNWKIDYSCLWESAYKGFWISSDELEVMSECWMNVKPCIQQFVNCVAYFQVKLEGKYKKIIKEKST